MRIVAVFAGGPKGGWQYTVLGTSVFEEFVIPDPWIPPPLDLGPPLPGEPHRRVTYRYVRSVSGRALGRRWLHLYVLDPADRDMTWPCSRRAPSSSPWPRAGPGLSPWARSALRSWECWPGWDSRSPAPRVSPRIWLTT
jgi:hypothetical protein